MTAEVVVTTAAGPLRRSLGPTAWALLEHLTAETSDEVGTRVAHTNVRRLATELGLGRDAIASAVQALALGGYLRIEPTRSDVGRFTTCRYVVPMNPALRRLDGPFESPPSSTTRPGGRSQPPAPAQVTLMEGPDDDDSPSGPVCEADGTGSPDATTTRAADARPGSPEATTIRAADGHPAARCPAAR